MPALFWSHSLSTVHPLGFSFSGTRTHFQRYFLGQNGCRLGRFFSGSLGGNGAINCSIGQALADHAEQRYVSAHFIIDSELYASVLTEIELGEIAVQMALIHVLIDTDQTALEDREEAFKRVRVDVATDVFALGVIDAFMLTDRHEFAVEDRTVRDQAALPIQVFVKRALDGLMVQVHGADLSAAFDQAQHLARALTFDTTALGRFAEVHFVSLDGHSGAANGSIAPGLDNLTDAMAEEPCGLHGTLQHPLDLTGTDAFLGCAEQVDDLKPQMQRQVRGFKDRTDANRKRLFAGVALAQAKPRGLAVQASDAIRLATVRADRTVGPQARFDVGECSGFGLELRGVENGLGHGLSPVASHYMEH